MTSNKENPRFSRVSLPANSNSHRPGWEELSPGQKGRRSLAPRKSILKFNNASNDTTQELSTADNTQTDMRKSLARRVSFAQNAQVRLYNKDTNPDGTASPSNAAASSSTSNAPRRSSMKKRRSSTGRIAAAEQVVNEEWEEGDSSMDIEDDGIVPNAQLYVAGNVEAEEPSYEEEPSEDVEEDEDDMDMTTAFENNIVVTNGRRRSSARPPPPPASDQSEDQPSSAPPSPARSTRTDASEPMEFTVALEQAILPSKRASLANVAWADLQALQKEHQVDVQASPSNDMDVEAAMKRMLAASPGTAKQRALDVAADDEGDSMDMSMDESQAGGDQSMGRYREDQTMDLTSIVQAQFSVREDREQELLGNDQPLLDNPFLAEQPSRSPENDPAPLFPLSDFTFTSQRVMPLSQDAPAAAEPLALPPLNLSTATPSQPLLNLSTSSTTHSKPPSQGAGASRLFPSNDATSLLSRSTSEGPPPSPKESIFGSLLASTSSVFSRSKIPSPVKRSARLSSAPPTAAPLPLISFSSPPKSANPPTPGRQTPSRARTPTRPTPTPTRTPTRATTGTPNRKRPASPVKSSSPSKKLAVGPDAQNQRAVSAEPRPTTQAGGFLTVNEATEIGGRETSAPPELQSSTSSNLPGRRASSSFAQRRAKKVSIAPPATSGGSLNLSTIMEQRESLGNVTVLQSAVEEEEEAPVSAPVSQEPVWDEYQQPIASGGGDSLPPANRSFGDRPKISVAEFLDLAGITFHDSMPIQRRHTIGPDPDKMVLEDGTIVGVPGEDHEFSLADYYRAEAVDIAQMEVYFWATTEIKKLMSDLREELGLLEEEIEENPPAALLDYLEADEEVRPQIEFAFKQARTYARRLMKGEWYRWKRQWMMDLPPKVDEEIQNLEQHLEFVREQRESLRDPMEELKKMHASLKEELEREKEVAAEIDACDPDQLEGLKAGIAEQDTAIEEFKKDLNEATSELERQTSQLRERQAEYQAAQDVIASSKRRGEMLGTTKDDVFRKKAWYDILQDLHGWKVSKVAPELLEIVHLPLNLSVHIPMEYFRPRPEAISIKPISGAELSPKLKQFHSFVEALVAAGSQAVKSGSFASPRDVVRCLDVLWASHSLVLTELSRLWIKHPLTVRYQPEDGSLAATVTILIRPKSKPELKAKALLNLTFPKEALAQWPLKMGSIGVQATISYGPIQSTEIASAIRERLQICTADQHYCSLYDACSELVAKYEA